MVGIVPDTHSGRPTSQYQWDTDKKWLIVNGLARSTRPCTFGGFEKISILRASPAPDQSPARTRVRLPESGYGRPAPQLSWDIRTKSLTVTG